MARLGAQRGALIVFEGAEGVGKSTQVQRLVQRLEDRGVPNLVFREPGGTILGDQIRQLLLDPINMLVLSSATEALLFMASRAQLIDDYVRPALTEGKVVVLDRFFLSTYAYQIHGRGLDEKRVVEANQLAVSGLKPDLNLVLRLPVQQGLERADARGERDRIEQADAAFHERVSTAFATFVMESWQRAHPECGVVAEVDARGTPDEVFERIVQTVERYCPGVL